MSDLPTEHPDAALSNEQMVEKVATREQDDFARMRASTMVRVIRVFTAVAGAIAPGLLVKWVDRIFKSPKRYPRPESEEALLATGMRRSFETRHGELVGWEWGEGPLVHLIHGWEGRGSQLATAVPALVEAGFRVITWDAPAHGDSPGKRASAVSFGEAAADIAKITGQPYAVYAHSMGASVTSVAMWEGYTPERFVYIAPGTAPEKPLRMVEQVLGVPPKVMARFMDQAIEGYRMDWEKIRDGGLPDGIDAPLLMIHDRGDREVSFLTTYRLQKNWPGSQIVLTNGLSHNRILQDEAVIAQAVAFIAAGKAEA